MKGADLGLRGVESPPPSILLRLCNVRYSGVTAWYITTEEEDAAPRGGEYKIILHMCVSPYNYVYFVLMKKQKRKRVYKIYNMLCIRLLRDFRLNIAFYNSLCINILRNTYYINQIYIITYCSGQ